MSEETTVQEVQPAPPKPKPKPQPRPEPRHPQQEPSGGEAPTQRADQRAREGPAPPQDPRGARNAEGGTPPADRGARAARGPEGDGFDRGRPDRPDRDIEGLVGAFSDSFGNVASEAATGKAGWGGAAGTPDPPDAARGKTVEPVWGGGKVTTVNDGNRVTVKSPGNVRESWNLKSKTYSRRDSDGTVTTTRPDGSQVARYKDGRVVETFSRRNGDAVSRTRSREDGAQVTETTVDRLDGTRTETEAVTRGDRTTTTRVDISHDDRPIEQVAPRTADYQDEGNLPNQWEERSDSTELGTPEPVEVRRVRTSVTNERTGKTRPVDDTTTYAQETPISSKDDANDPNHPDRYHVGSPRFEEADWESGTRTVVASETRLRGGKRVDEATIGVEVRNHWKASDGGRPIETVEGGRRTYVDGRATQEQEYVENRGVRHNQGEDYDTGEGSRHADDWISNAIPWGQFSTEGYQESDVHQGEKYLDEIPGDTTNIRDTSTFSLDAEGNRSFQGRRVEVGAYDEPEKPGSNVLTVDIAPREDADPAYRSDGTATWTLRKVDEPAPGTVRAREFTSTEGSSGSVRRETIESDDYQSNQVEVYDANGEPPVYRAYTERSRLLEPHARESQVGFESQYENDDGFLANYPKTDGQLRDRFLDASRGPVWRESTVVLDRREDDHQQNQEYTRFTSEGSDATLELGMLNNRYSKSYETVLRDPGSRNPLQATSIDGITGDESRVSIDDANRVRVEGPRGLSETLELEPSDVDGLVTAGRTAGGFNDLADSLGKRFPARVSGPLRAFNAFNSLREVDLSDPADQVKALGDSADLLSVGLLAGKAVAHEGTSAARFLGSAFTRVSGISGATGVVSGGIRLAQGDEAGVLDILAGGGTLAGTLGRAGTAVPVVGWAVGGTATLFSIQLELDKAEREQYTPADPVFE